MRESGASARQTTDLLFLCSVVLYLSEQVGVRLEGRAADHTLEGGVLGGEARRKLCGLPVSSPLQLSHTQPVR
jgi:hypothetical protein